MHDILSGHSVEIVPVGSRVTCNPPPMDTDEDYLIKTKSETDYLELCYLLQCDSWEYCGDDDYATMDECVGLFSSYRKGDMNYIITDDQNFFNEFIRATAIAKEHNLLHKQERIDLFQWILYDEFNPELDCYLDSIGISYPPSVLEMIDAIRTYKKEK